jgi:hypothetical protein
LTPQEQLKREKLTKWSPWIGEGDDKKVNKLPKDATVKDVDGNFRSNLELYHWFQDLKQMDFKDCFELEKITADQKFIEITITQKSKTKQTYLTPSNSNMTRITTQSTPKVYFRMMIQSSHQKP